MSFKSVNSENAVDVVSEPDQSVGTQHNELATFLSFPKSSVSGNYAGLDLFNTPFASETVISSASSPDLFQLPKTSSDLAVDFFQPSSLSSVSTSNSQQLSKTLPPSSSDLFSDIPQQQPLASLNEISSEAVIQKNIGWATFDIPQRIKPSQGIENSTNVPIPSYEDNSVRNTNQHFLLNTTTHWSSFHDTSVHGPHSSMLDQWHESLQNVEATLSAGSNQQSWNAFENPIGQLPLESIFLQRSEQVSVQNPSSVVDQYLGLRVAEDSGRPIPSIQSHASVSSHVSPVIPVMAGTLSHATTKKSTNPFDIPYDSDFESSNAFLDMSSLQAVLPNGQMPTSFSGGVCEPWFTENLIAPFIPAGSQGALGLLGGPAPGSQLTSVSSQGPVAPIGGNPFA